MFQFGYHRHCGQALNCKVGYVCHTMDSNEVRHLFNFHYIGNSTTLWNVEAPLVLRHIKCFEIRLLDKAPNSLN
jgi:hypothetical protein